MGRVVVGVELVALLALGAIPAIWDGGLLLLSVAPAALVVLVPAAASLSIWEPRVLVRAIADGLSGRRPRSDTSLSVWRFLERSTYFAGFIGALGAIVVFLGHSSHLGLEGIAGLVTPALLLGFYALLFGILFRIVHSALRQLSAKTPERLSFEVSEEFCRSYRITPRELQVIELILRGLAYREVADALFLSIKTVKTHVYHVYEKTSSANKIELLQLLQFKFIQRTDTPSGRPER